MTDGGGRIVDCDVHCHVPAAAALAPYLEPHWQEFLRVGIFRAPQAVAMTYPAWLPMLAMNGDDLTLERLQRDVLDGVELAVLHCYYAVESFTHPYLAAAMATAVNRWVQEEWLDRDDRLLASAVVTPQYPEAAVAEIERIAEDPRFVQVLVPARASSPYGNQRYWPIWRAAAERGLHIAITAGGGSGSPPTPVNWLSSFYEEYSVATLNFQAHVTSFAVSGLFDLYPDLRVIAMESGWTWLPPLFWRLDQEWKAFQREVPWMKGAPSSYIRRHVRFTTHPFDAPPTPGQFRHVLEQIGSDGMLLYGSDYPHRYRDDLETLLSHVDPAQAQMILHGNAADCYCLDTRAGASGR